MNIEQVKQVIESAHGLLDDISTRYNPFPKGSKEYAVYAEAFGAGHNASGLDEDGKEFHEEVPGSPYSNPTLVYIWDYASGCGNALASQEI